MAHTYHKLRLHLVFATKNRQLLITSDVERDIYSFIENKLLEMNCTVWKINGMPDHIHILLSCYSNSNISDIVKKLKGSSARWINEKQLIQLHFEWQVGYSIFSVSGSQVAMIANYIKNQKKHHKNMTYEEKSKRYQKLNDEIQLSGL